MTNEFNFQLPPEGFDSYLVGVLPEYVGVAAGAFSISMQQIKNIDTIDIQKFAKTVYSIETNNGLPLTNGTNIPTEAFVVDSALSKVALGSGLYGTYTYSDFLGSMSALPYPLQNIYDGIKELQTQTLISIYQNLYLAVSWEQATAIWDGITFTYTNRGGGYGRGTGAPSVTVGGNPATATIGTDPNDLDTFGKIISISYSGPAAAVLIDDPPGGGWTSMNTTIQNYIDAANNEIQSIAINAQNFERVKLLNANWNQLGTALKIEHRARYTAIPPVPIPRDPFLALYPTSLYNFVDSIPDFAANTMPHGPAQSLEMMSDQCSVGGQSLIGMMRQERNQQRLDSIGIPLDNNIPDTMSEEDQRQIMANGTKCGATNSSVDINGNVILGAGIPAENGLSFTMPAFPVTENCAEETLKPDKTTTYDDTEGALRKYEGSVPGSIAPLLVDPPCNAIAGPEIPVGASILLGTGIPSFYRGSGGTEDETGNALPTLLNVDYTSGTLLPSQYNIPDAIDKVIECNCDCWVQ